MQRRASALILVVGLIVVMAAMAASFLSLMSQRRNLAYRLAARQRVDVFVDDVQADIIRRLHEDTADGVTSFADDWYRAHQHVNADGDPVWAWEEPSLDPRINLGSGRPTWTHWGRTLGYGDGIDMVDGVDNVLYPVEQVSDTYVDTDLARWRYEHYLNEDLTPATDRDTAQYALRYAANVFDNNGLLRILPDHPTPTPILASGQTGYRDFLAYQNYKWHFARSLKSMLSTEYDDGGGARVTQHTPADPELHPRWPWDREYVGFGLDGSRKLARNDDLPQNIGTDFRVRMANWFLETGLQPLGNDGQAWQTLPMGPLVPRQFLITIGNADAGRIDWPFYPILLGRAPGLRDDALDGEDPVTTPWAVNIMTAPRQVLHAVVFGLSKRMSRGPSVELFGEAYPEPFPLSLEEGRYIRLIGANTGSSAAPYGRRKMPGQVLNNSAVANDEAVSLKSQHLGYGADIVAALDLAVTVARQACNEGREPDASASFIDEQETDPVRMRANILRELLRIIGEPDIRQGTPPVSFRGIISGGVQPVGYGGQLRSLTDSKGELTWAGMDDDDDAATELGFLAPGIDSRAVEYLLNDICISLLGSANPEYDPATATSYQGIAVDFNGDGMAESSVTGWWNGERTVWSWWWNGLGPDESLDPDLADNSVEHSVPAWMQQPTWYRIDPVGPQGLQRWNGHSWVAVATLSGGGDFLTINKQFLHGSGQWPNANLRPGIWGGSSGVIRPFAHSGRLFVGLSRSFTILTRCQLYELKSEQVLIERNQEATWHRDPDGDGKSDDAYIDYSSPFEVIQIRELY